MRTRYEHKQDALLPKRAFYARMARHGLLAAALVSVSLGLGVLGYHYIACLRWVDALENAAMILTGMGPTAPMPTDGAKVFASAYALFSGIAFISTVGVMIAPAAHRLLHRFHIQGSDRERQ